MGYLQQLVLIHFGKIHRFFYHRYCLFSLLILCRGLIFSDVKFSCKFLVSFEFYDIFLFFWAEMYNANIFFWGFLQYGWIFFFSDACKSSLMRDVYVSFWYLFEVLWDLLQWNLKQRFFRGFLYVLFSLSSSHQLHFFCCFISLGFSAMLKICALACVSIKFIIMCIL